MIYNIISFFRTLKVREKNNFVAVLIKRRVLKKEQGTQVKKQNKNKNKKQQQQKNIYHKKRT